MKQYQVTGMSCAACSARVEKAVRSVPGVKDCAVSLLTNSMGVDGTAEPQEIVAAVEAAGYGAAPKLQGKASAPAVPEKSGREELNALKHRLLASVFFLLMLLYFSMGHMLFGWPLPLFFQDNHTAIGLLELLLSAAVMSINQQFFIRGFQGIWHRAPNMDTLVALGAAAAFAYSTAALFQMTAAQAAGNLAAAAALMQEFYFESAAMILTLITVGKLLEARAKGRTTDALRGLMALAPQTAVLLKDGQEIVTPIAQVQKEAVFVVRPGENIPVDGCIIKGSSAVNEAALTGESLPVDKSAGDFVSAGTMNQSGFLECRATRVGEDTTLAQIIRLVSDAAATKAPIARMADKVSGVFVPVVILLAVLTVLVWLFLGETFGFALARGIAVLVISCPCALGLATPVAIMVGNGVGARHGILFKTAAALEEVGKGSIVVLDKTGTITSGRPRVTDKIAAEGFSSEDLLLLAAALEKKSEHPLAQAILAEVKGKNIPEVEEFQALPGHGLTAKLAGKQLLGGSLLYLETQLEVSSALREKAQSLAAEGKTPLLFARDGRVAGIIAAADAIKEDSLAAIRALQSMGLRVIMLTGDNKATADAIAVQAGVDEVIAGVLPAGKEAVVRRLQQDGPVIMVGDGINDAPALTRADTGIAIGAGADIALDAAGVVLMKDRLSDVPEAIRLSRATLRNIKQNLFWAFFYNIIGIPLAAGLWIPVFGWTLNPVFAAAAMSLSSFSVVTNALRLNFVKLAAGKGQKNGSKREAEEKMEGKTMKKTLMIEGMMCGHCEAAVKKALEALPGVEAAVVSHEKGTAVVTLRSEVPEESLKKAVEARDYTVKDIQ